jgi:hypothetical protein
VDLRFAPTSVFQPVNLPILISLITVPDDGHGGLSYAPSFHVSTNDLIVPWYAPPDDLFACFPVTIHRGSFLVPYSFVLSPGAHLIIAASLTAAPTAGAVHLEGTVSGNVSYG